MRTSLVAWILCGGLTVGCVSQERYDRAVHDVSAAKLSAAESEKRHGVDGAEIAQLRDALAKSEQASQERDASIAELKSSAHNSQAALDEATAINQQLRGELERLGKDVDKILKDRGDLTKQIADAKARLDELRRAQAAAEARTALFKDFQRKFAKMIDGGQLQIGVRNGFLVMALSSDLLFDPGRIEIKTAGQGALLEIAHAFASIPALGPSAPASSAAAGRKFQVAAHTDDSKTKNSRYPTNWELSAVRAVEIVRFLIAQHVPPQMLSAAGDGDVDPVASNAAADGRAKNRRVEFVLMPNADDLVVPAEWK